MLQPKLYNSIEEILEQANKIKMHRVSEFNVNKRSLSKNNKGVIGQIVEEGVFHYPINSNHEADFSNLGVELKVTGLKKDKKNHLSMKERLVLNIINYQEEAKVDFENSSFWKKNACILILFYLFEYELSDYDFMFLDSFLHRFNQKDLIIIKNDWDIIHNKIINGNAHNISEADTMYLAACTKGSKANKELRKQPYSNELAKQRAYCLKTSYMNTIVDVIFSKEKMESIIECEELQNKSFEQIIITKLKPFFGKSENDLFQLFNVPQNSKAKYNLLVGCMLGIHGVINKTEEFRKANIELKTIRVEEDGNIQQHMSFPYFKYTEIINQEWEESDIYEKLSTTKFIFVIFKKNNNIYYFEDAFFWNMPIKDIEEYVKPVFYETINCIKSGNILKEVTDLKCVTNFPGSTFNGVCHVRPHDQKSFRQTNKGLELPIPDKLTGFTSYTKYCFWLDKRYIKDFVLRNKY